RVDPEQARAPAQPGQASQEVSRLGLAAATQAENRQAEQAEGDEREGAPIPGAGHGAAAAALLDREATALVDALEALGAATGHLGVARLGAQAGALVLDALALEAVLREGALVAEQARRFRI